MVIVQVYQENYARAKAEYDIILKEYKLKKAQVSLLISLIKNLFVIARTVRR